MSVADLRVLRHLVLHRAKGDTHADRLESFYGGQARDYDDFRRRLLHGREEMIAALRPAAGETWVDLGAGTGSNAELPAGGIGPLRHVYQVDLCRPLLDAAEERIGRHGWTNVTAVHADATAWRPPRPADVVTFSYSLTMIPEWFAAIDNALSLLKPGGRVGVVDFFVSRKHDQARHRWSTRTFWPAWFAADDVFLSPDHLPYLRRRFTPLIEERRLGKVPYLPLVRAPHYWFVGRKPVPTKPDA